MDSGAVRTDLPPLNSVLTECGSTQSVARAWAERGAAHGSWISAQRQTEGRGRRERIWISSEGNLFISIIVRGIHPRLWTWIPLAAAIAVRRAAIGLLGSEWDARLSIKWPNDLFLDGVKAGGILCESSLSGDVVRSFVIVGVGVNCAEAPLLADRSSARIPVSADALRTGVISALSGTLEELGGAGGVERISQAFSAVSLFKVGDSCRWREESGVEGDGVVLGLGRHGELKVEVRSKDGIEVRHLSSEEVSFGGVRYERN